MDTLKNIAKNRAHQRVIQIATYDVDESHVLLEGELIDTRLCDYYLISGEKRDAGKIHHIKILLLISTDSMAIENYEVAMIAVPRDACRELLPSLEVIKGLRIIKGFSMRIRSLLGGVKGCTHIVTLLTEMAPAFLQGFWTLTSQKPVDKTSSKDVTRVRKFRDTLKNTCWVWREDGPAYQKIKNTLESID